jgi:hypothetical protein
VVEESVDEPLVGGGGGTVDAVWACAHHGAQPNKQSNDATTSTVVVEETGERTFMIDDLRNARCRMFVPLVFDVWL